MEDRELALRAARGDRSALEMLAERYRRYVYTIAWRIVPAEDDALDITQTVMLRLTTRIGQFRGEAPFRSWLAVIATNEALNFLRARKRKPERATDPDLLETVEHDPAAYGAVHASQNPLAAAVCAERRQQIDAAMRGLPPQQRAVFMLRFVEELKPREIAAELGISPGQTRSALCHAIKRLREMLGEDLK